MTQRVTRRRPESREAKYNRLNKRAVRRMAMTAAEVRWLWTEKSNRMNRRAQSEADARLINYFEIGQDPDSPDAEVYGDAVSRALRDR